MVETASQPTTHCPLPIRHPPCVASSLKMSEVRDIVRGGYAQRRYETALAIPYTLAGHLALGLLCNGMLLIF